MDSTIAPNRNFLQFHHMVPISKASKPPSRLTKVYLSLPHILLSKNH